MVLAEAAEGYAKHLWTDAAGGPKPVLATCPDEGAQAGAVAEVILEQHDRGTLLRQQVVLFRSAHHSDLLEMELHRRGIPYVKYGGLRFLEAAISATSWPPSGCWKTLSTSWPGSGCCSCSMG